MGVTGREAGSRPGQALCKDLILLGLLTHNGHQSLYHIDKGRCTPVYNVGSPDQSVSLQGFEDIHCTTHRQEVCFSFSVNTGNSLQ